MTTCDSVCGLRLCICMWFAFHLLYYIVHAHSSGRGGGGLDHSGLRQKFKVCLKFMYLNVLIFLQKCTFAKILIIRNKIRFQHQILAFVAVSLRHLQDCPSISPPPPTLSKILGPPLLHLRRHGKVASSGIEIPQSNFTLPSLAGVTFSSPLFIPRTTSFRHAINSDSHLIL